MKWLKLEGANAVFVKTFQELYSQIKDLEVKIFEKNRKISEMEKDREVNKQRFSKLDRILAPTAYRCYYDGSKVMASEIC